MPRKKAECFSSLYTYARWGVGRYSIALGLWPSSYPRVAVPPLWGLPVKSDGLQGTLLLAAISCYMQVLLWAVGIAPGFRWFLVSVSMHEITFFAT